MGGKHLRSTAKPVSFTLPSPPVVLLSTTLYKSSVVYFHTSAQGSP